MKNSVIFILFFTAISFFSFGQDSDQLTRTPYKLSVAVDKKSVYEEDIKATQYVLPNNTIQLYPGETVYVEIEQENGMIKNMKAVKEIIDASKTLTIRFTQASKKKVHEQMMLEVKNPFSQNLVYEAKIFLLQQNKWVDTDVFPVEAGLSGFEMWPDIIISIGLGNWSFQNK